MTVRLSKVSRVKASRRVVSVVVVVVDDLRVCSAAAAAAAGDGLAAEVGRLRFWRTDALRSAMEAARDGWWEDIFLAFHWSQRGESLEL